MRDVGQEDEATRERREGRRMEKVYLVKVHFTKKKELNVSCFFEKIN